MFKRISYNRIRQGHRLFVVVLVFASVICFVNLQFGAIRRLPSVTTPLYDLQETENASTDSNVEDPVPQPSPLITSSSIESTENLKDPIQQSSSLITNNYMEYPRLPPAPLETLHTLRRLHLQKLQAIIEDPLPKSASEHWNIEQLKGLVHYWNNEVGPNGKLQQPKVILTSDGNVPCAISLCSTTDEVVWLGSLMEVFREQGYFLLYHEYENIGKAYKRYGDLVTHVWSSDEHVIWCFNDTISCIESQQNPQGIPPWKLFTFTFWGSPIGWQKFMAPQEPWSYNPLGGEWNLVPYQMPDNQFYLGYYLSECQNISYIAPSERKDQVLILANRSASFHRPYNMLDISRWPSIVKGIAGELINLSENEDGYPIPKGLVGLGPQDREAYSLLLRDSKASLGIGHPQLSTGPYASLCHGVPVILPFKSRRCPAHPPSTDWCGFTGNLNLHQHGAIASTLSEPFVYMVDVEERKDDLVATIWRAMKTPIEPIVFPEMTVEALTRRVEDYFHIDWKELAARRMLDRGWNEVVTQEFMYAWLEKHPVTPQIP